MNFLIDDINNVNYLDECTSKDNWNILLSMTLNNVDGFSIQIFIKKSHIHEYVQLINDLNIFIDSPRKNISEMRYDDYLNIFLVNFEKSGIKPISAGIHNEEWMDNYIRYLSHIHKYRKRVSYYFEAPVDDIMNIIKNHKFVVETEKLDPTYEQRRPKGQYCMNI